MRSALQSLIDLRNVVITRATAKQPNDFRVQDIQSETLPLQYHHLPIQGSRTTIKATGRPGYLK